MKVPDTLLALDIPQGWALFFQGKYLASGEVSSKKRQRIKLRPGVYKIGGSQLNSLIDALVDQTYPCISKLPGIDTIVLEDFSAVYQGRSGQTLAALAEQAGAILAQFNHGKEYRINSRTWMKGRRDEELAIQARVIANKTATGVGEHERDAIMLGYWLLCHALELQV